MCNLQEGGRSTCRIAYSTGSDRIAACSLTCRPTYSKLNRLTSHRYCVALVLVGLGGSMPRNAATHAPRPKAWPTSSSLTPTPSHVLAQEPARKRKRGPGPQCGLLTARPPDCASAALPVLGAVLAAHPCMLAVRMSLRGTQRYVGATGFCTFISY